MTKVSSLRLPGFSRFWFSAAVLLFLMFLTVFSSGITKTVCREDYRADRIVAAASQQIRTEVVSSDQEQEKGLSGRECIGPNHGMLFIFSEPGRYNFWMKDMKFPIDILWLDSEKKVIEVTADISPDSYPQTFTSANPASYVLEVKAGQAAKLGLYPGIRLQF